MSKSLASLPSFLLMRVGNDETARNLGFDITAILLVHVC